jgi:hypothetical protein
MHEKHKSTFPNATSQKKGGNVNLYLKEISLKKASTLLISAVICDNVEKN